MKTWKKICGVTMLAVLWLGGAALPDWAVTVHLLRSDNPCGKVICCCPHDCKTTHSKLQTCKMTSRSNCGFKAARQPGRSISDHPPEVFRITYTKAFLPIDRQSLKIFSVDDLPFSSHSRRPLDKPPPFFS